MTEPAAIGLKARGLLRLGLAAARRQGQLLVPLVVAEALATLLNLVPGLVLLGRILGESWRVQGVDPATALALGTVVVLADASTYPLVFAGIALAGFGAWLLRIFVAGGVVRALSGQVLRDEPVDDDAFAAALTEDPGRWLAAAGLAAVLRMIAFVCALGAVAAAMVFFTEVPGVAAALGMTFATVLVVLLPVTDAALDVGFVRAVAGREGPVEALGEGILLAARRSRDLLPVWWLGVMLELGIGLAAAVVGALGPSTGDTGLQALLLGPEALLFLLTTVVLSSVALVRYAAYAALVRDDAGDLPVLAAEPLPPPPAPPPPADGNEPIYEAIPLAPANETVH